MYDTDAITFARGYSLNYFSEDGKFDLFVIINEPNPIEKIDEAIDYIDSYDMITGSLEELHDALEEKYFPYGVELLRRDDKDGLYKSSHVYTENDR